jgi:FAD/FMN-containing dehydrogenase
LKKKRLRAIGAGVSPNGFAFNDDETLVSLEMCSKIVSIDEKQCRVTVEAGCTVGRLAKVLLKHKMTMTNFASIEEQQIGGIFVYSVCKILYLNNYIFFKNC